MFEYGPPDLNLYKHVAKKTHSLWKTAKENVILKDEGEPIDGFLVLHIDGENILENCLEIFDFELDEGSQQEGNLYNFNLLLDTYLFTKIIKAI